MQLDCQRLVFSLELVSGCLQSLEMIPVLTHICFVDDGSGDGSANLYAFDDKAATVVNMSTGLNCGVRGDQMIKMLKPYKGDVLLVQQAEAVSMKGRDASGSLYQATLAALSDESFVYEDPRNSGPGLSVPLTDDLIDALIMASESVSQNAIEVDWSGVNLLFDDGVTVCAFDNMTCVVIAFPDLAVEKMLKGIKGRVIIPRPTIAQIKRVYTSVKEKDNADERRLFISDQHIAAQFRSRSSEVPDVKVVSKLIPSELPFDFIGVCNGYLDQATAFADLPSGSGDKRFESSIKRAVAACEGDEDARLRISVDGTELVLSVDAARSRLDDRHKLKQVPGDAAVSVNPEHVERFLAVAQQFSIVPNKAICFNRGDDYYIVAEKSVSRKSRKKEA